MKHAHVIEDTATHDDARTYRLLPFEMPDNAVQVTVRYQYGEDLRAGSGVIDIGIFDARGADFMGAGFRGWSGSARSEFVITLDQATPGYTPGALQAGTWHVCLGLYEIAEGGCDYRVEIDIETDTAEAMTPAYLPLSQTPRPDRRRADSWYKGDLHCHTFHSDGDSDPLDVVRKAESLGFDFIAITDHNVLTHQISLRDADTPLLLIPGMEVTTYFGHWNVWGDAGWLDFRVQAADDMRQAMQAAVERGYLVSCNHPKNYGPPWEFPEVDGYHCVEVWNGPWAFFNEQALAFWEAHLRAGRRYTAVGGSDAHFHQREHPAQLGLPTTYIYCEGDPSPAKLLAALREGAVFVTDGPQLDLRCGDAIMGQAVDGDVALTFTVQVRDGADCTLQLVGPDGLLYADHVTTAAQTFTYKPSAIVTGYVRAQLIEGQQIRALTNPIYIT